ncbi:hypothetical protein Cyast_0823 [Cyanobacterium stanieri PCC 7202]|uniref:Uncharacterized protein n=1 Tax=Cyanobacterium stanieri (strain ATCC 29140 / PCC 7202) TaxID=292563 RepID=K9YK76_CYASC|nr:hypothetical protein Cyast_0823 [Cyanobacterium stanieri PCC 7202]
MQLTINIPDNLSKEKISLLIKDIEEILIKEGINLEIKPKVSKEKTDPWDEIDFSEIAVDTGIEDFAENHDHYLYGTLKK